jgi:hypothetical protein
MTQKEEILEFLKTGQTLTWLDAVKKFGSSRLGARIWDLKKDGWEIKSKLIEVNGKHVSEYKLILPAQPSLFGEVS